MDLKDKILRPTTYTIKVIDGDKISDELATAQALIHYEAVLDAADLIRKHIPIGVVPAAGIKSHNDIQDYLENLTELDRDAVLDASIAITNKYGLGNYWMLPLAYMFLTDELPVLPDKGINVYDPKSASFGYLFSALGQDGDYIVVRLTRKMKLQQLRDYLDDPVSGRILQRLLNRLPNRPSGKIEVRTLFYGYASDVVRREMKSTWPNTLRFIETSIVGVSKVPAIPLSSEDLRKMQSNYVKYRDNTGR